MKFETSLLLCSLVGTVVNWSLIYQYQMKRKLLLSILSIPFGFVGVLFAIVIGVDGMLEYALDVEVKDIRKVALILSLVSTVLFLLFLAW